MHARFRHLGGLALIFVLATIAVVLTAAPDLRLVAAAKDQNKAIVRALLKDGVDASTASTDGATALHWAAHWDDAELVDLLLKARANVNAANDHGVTPLDLASENASTVVIDRLLAAGADAHHAQKSGLTPLMTASRGGNLTAVKALLAHGADVNAVILENGQTALMWATAERQLDVMRALVAAGANVHARSKIGFTPLLFTARNGDIEAATILIAAGAGVNEIGSDGTHPLPLAVVSGNDQYALFLLDQKANANGRMFGVTALHAAAAPVDMWLRGWYRERGVDYSRLAVPIDPARRVALAKALIAHGADPNARITESTGVQGWLTLKNGAFEPFSVGTGDLKGATPLWVAAFDMHGQQYSGAAFGDRSVESTSRKPDILRVLLEGGADLTLTTDDKTTPLMAAAGLGHGTYLPGQARGARTPDAEEAVKILIEAGADVNITNEARFTALHGAAFKGLNEVIEYLVAHGANINAQDYMKRTAFRMAEGSKQTFQFQEWPETAEFLKKLGADTTLGVAGRVQERQRDAAGKNAEKQQR